MDLKDKLISSFMAFENNVDVEHSVHDVRTAAMKNFENKGLSYQKGGSLEIHLLEQPSKDRFQYFPKGREHLGVQRCQKVFCT